uniref:Uncharacterized protein n=1 Tax=Romanomermis culicivorax TaxID=13658 RepID=A0A915L6B8_ROMCU
MDEQADNLPVLDVPLPLSPSTDRRSPLTTTLPFMAAHSRIISFIATGLEKLAKNKDSSISKNSSHCAITQHCSSSLCSFLPKALKYRRQPVRTYILIRDFGKKAIFKATFLVLLCGMKTKPRKWKLHKDRDNN